MLDKDLKRNLDYYGAFFDAMFWADVDGCDDIENDYDILDINKDSLEKLINDLDLFFEKADPILENTEYDHSQACHDFYFTRQGHGVGFWENDHCNEEQGKLLTEIAQDFGEIYITEGSNKNSLYVE